MRMRARVTRARKGARRALALVLALLLVAGLVPVPSAITSALAEEAVLELGDGTNDVEGVLDEGNAVNDGDTGVVLLDGTGQDEDGQDTQEEGQEDEVELVDPEVTVESDPDPEGGVQVLGDNLADPEVEVRALPSGVSVSNPRVVPDSSMTAGQVATWDCVWFGFYPQESVASGDAVYSRLRSASWDANGDTTIGDTRYRRISRKDATDDKYWWEDDLTYCYFRYEPIKWRVLEVSGTTALLVADKALDSQRFRSYNNTGGVAWGRSTIRSWLNGYDGATNNDSRDFSNKGFITTAFSASERAALCPTFKSSGTEDRVFLLSKYDVLQESFGFAKWPGTYDEARRCERTAFSVAMGGSTDGWWLRTPRVSSLPGVVLEDKMSYDVVNNRGYAVSSSLIANTNLVRPATSIDLSSPCVKAAGTVSSDGQVSEIAYEPERTPEVAKGETYKKSGMRYKVTRVATAEKKGTVTLVKAKNAKKVTVPASVRLADGRVYCVTAVGKGALKGLSKTTAVVVGSKVAKIGAGAFSNLPKLTSVTLGTGVKKVAKGAFANTPKLRAITVKGKLLKKKSCVKGMLKGSKVRKAVTVKVPKSVRKTYRKVFTKSNLTCPKKVVVK